jgi:hypothetical protein
VGMAVQRSTSNLGFSREEVNLLDDRGPPMVQGSEVARE